MNVILVDDDAAERRSLTLLLRARGHNVDDYGGGQAVLAAGLSDDATCLIADYLMLDIDDLSLLKSLRAQRWSGPAMLISGHFDAALEHRAHAVGYAAVFENPLRSEHLLKVVAPLAAMAPNAPC